MQELLEQIDELPNADKWRLVNRLLQELEQAQAVPQSDWHEKLRATFGILSDDPIERPPQLPLEKREPIE